ncbi:hypothetical protein ACFL1Y_00020 [Patescibacteria group bacterium]
MDINIREYREKRKMFKTWGIRGFVIAGTIFLLFGTPFPTPFVVVPLIYLSIIIAIVSFFVFFLAKINPNTEIVTQIAKTANGYITAGILIDQLGLSIGAAESVIKSHFLNGYLVLMNKVTNETHIAQWITQFIGVGPKAEGVACPTNTGGDQKNEDQPQVNLSELTADLPELNVSDINNMILANTMSLGSSGQPIHSDQSSRRRRFF